jgi:hypothetical protein
MKVHYLCHPPNETVDFVYAAELPSGYYAPGMFCIEASDVSGSFVESFKFPARLGERLITTNLTRVGTRTYIVDVDELATRFFFKIVSLDKTARYIGRESSRFTNFPLSRVQPANTTLRTGMCQS